MTLFRIKATNEARPRAYGEVIELKHLPLQVAFAVIALLALAVVVAVNYIYVDRTLLLRGSVVAGSHGGVDSSECGATTLASTFPTPPERRLHETSLILTTASNSVPLRVGMSVLVQVAALGEKSPRLVGTVYKLAPRPASASYVPDSLESAYDVHIRMSRPCFEIDGKAFSLKDGLRVQARVKVRTTLGSLIRDALYLPRSGRDA
jgi:hypothetical protein